MTNQLSGLARLIAASKYSWLGLCATFKHEQAFRLELIICVVLIPVALWLATNGVERALLIGSLLLVLIIEVINSAIEAVVDRIGSDKHELSGRAKDMGSAAVFISLVSVIVVWTFILIG